MFSSPARGIGSAVIFWNSTARTPSFSPPASAKTSADIRAAICANLDQLGIVLDAEKNNSTRATEAVISAAGSRVKIMVIPTNEELVVARETRRFLENKKN